MTAIKHFIINLFIILEWFLLTCETKHNCQSVAVTGL